MTDRSASRSGGASVRLLVWALIVQVALGVALVLAVVRGLPFAGEESPARSSPSAASAPAAGAAGAAPTQDNFDASRVLELAGQQVAYGPRPAGSQASRRLAEELRSLLPDGRFEDVSGGLRNIVGTLPGRKPAVVIGAHYDTKDLPDFVGANDGAAGTAAVIELARRAPSLRPAKGKELRFVLFDGEESPAGEPDATFSKTGLRGSRAYVKAHKREVGKAIVLDFIGQPGLSLPREKGSDANLWKKLRAAAGRAGVLDTFPPETRGEILDDHTPFNDAGIAAIDLIDFDYPYFHTRADTLDKLSADSLDRAGEAVAELIRSL